MELELDRADKKIVGTKQVKRALNNRELKTVYIAKDADEKLRNQIVEACNEQGIEIVYIETMEKLGKHCNIDVSAASAALLK